MDMKIQSFEKEMMSKEVPVFQIGDTVVVSVRIQEEGKSRVQDFEGVVIARKDSGVRSCFTVRRVAHGEGVERVFPIYSPFIEKVKVKRKGKVRRAKLYYLRDKVGKKAKIKERIDK